MQILITTTLAIATTDSWIEGFAIAVLVVVGAAVFVECAGAEALVVAADAATVEAGR